MSDSSHCDNDAIPYFNGQISDFFIGTNATNKQWVNLVCIQPITSGHAHVDDHSERRDDEMVVTKRAFVEALADSGQPKRVRKQVADLSDDDFQYLIAKLLANLFEPRLLEDFESNLAKDLAEALKK